ncbi:MAG: hypothetical protein ABGX22_19800 [Pirellulaceae bacterium]
MAAQVLATIVADGRSESVAPDVGSVAPAALHLHAANRLRNRKPIAANPTPAVAAFWLASAHDVAVASKKSSNRPRPAVGPLVLLVVAAHHALLAVATLHPAVAKKQVMTLKLMVKKVLPRHRIDR